MIRPVPRAKDRAEPGALDTADGGFHDDLPVAAEQAIRCAGLHWDDDTRAEHFLAEAGRLAPGHPAVLIARYRRAFYKHRFDTACALAEDLLGHAARRLNIPADWRSVRTEDARFDEIDPPTRFWMFVLQAYGYLLLRLGRAKEGEVVLRHLRGLDLQDQTRTRILLDVLDARGAEE
ncbi:MAG: hypothetical protein AB1592_13575 [Pseudomonadota bacterium]